MANSVESMRSLRGRNGQAHAALKSRAQDVMEDFTELRKDMSKLANAASKSARYEMRSTGRRLEKLGQEMRTQAEEGAGYMRAQVRARPAAAIGISLGAGVLAGLLLARR